MALMARSTPVLLPRISRLLVGLGERLKQARLRRAYAGAIVAQRAGIDRKTLVRVERGDPAVALGIYARVMQALGLEGDIAALADDDKLGRQLQDLATKNPRRAPPRVKRSSSA
jgi:transcriptional regulator with XRE-family HTH domain